MLIHIDYPGCTEWLSMIILIRDQPCSPSKYLPFYSMNWITNGPQMRKGFTTISTVVVGVGSCNGLVRANLLMNILMTLVTGWKRKTSHGLGGIFAGIDILYPYAFRELVTKFRKLGNLDLMKRCSLSVTTNLSESAHARLHTIAKKSSHRGLQRLMFAGQQIMLNSSLGHQKASLDCVLGTRSVLAKLHLHNKQKESLRVAQRTHVDTANVFDGTRLKRSSNANVLDRRVPGPQREPLIPSSERSAYVGNGQVD